MNITNDFKIISKINDKTKGLHKTIVQKYGTMDKRILDKPFLGLC